MDSVKFDRLARTFAKGVSRRGLLAVAGGFAIARRQQAHANQLTPSTCGASGEVCTLLMGCCDGLTCVTSAINTNYGVCIAGEGGTVSIGTTLISPFSEEVEQEVAALANGAASDTTSTTTTTDLEAEREQRIADNKLRKDNRRDDQKLRKETQKDDQQDRRDDRRDNRELRRGPRLEVDLLNPGGAGGTETVRIRNRDDASVLLTKIESILNPSVNTSLSRTVSVGGSFNFYSGITGDIADEDELLWNNTNVCSGATGTGAGIRIYVGFSSNSENREYEVLCDESDDGNGNPRRKKRKRKQQAGRGRKGRKSKNKNG